nr:hypothetical protein [Candidatus Microthrix sp.]
MRTSSVRQAVPVGLLGLAINTSRASLPLAALTNPSGSNDALTLGTAAEEAPDRRISCG